MQVYITAKYQNKEDISDLLNAISKAVDTWKENYPNLCEYDGCRDGIEVHLQPEEKSDTLNSEYEPEKLISQISDRLKSRSALRSHSQQ